MHQKEVVQQSATTIQYPKWFGGLASCMAVTFSHPLDLIKVRKQTNLTGSKQSTFGMVRGILKSEGIRGLYHGLSAGLLRQLTYGSTRFSIYETIKERASSNNAPPKVSVLIPAAAISGFIGGMIGNPADIANVRMQFDTAQPVESRRNYRNVFDALQRIAREEGFRGYTRGIWPNCIRAAGMTSCQLASYDGFKILLMTRAGLGDNLNTQLMASILASLVATTLCSPFDVVKTRAMNSSTPKPIIHTVRDMFHTEGVRWIFRGWLPSFARMGPHTVATLFFLEQEKVIYRLLKEVTVLGAAIT